MAVAKRWSWVVVGAYWAILLMLTHSPVGMIPGPPGQDKVGHFLAYFGLASVLYIAISLTWPSFRYAAVAAAAITMAGGALDEWTQPWVGRSCELGDWLADVGGAIVAVTLLAGIRAAWVGRRVVPPADATTMSA